jgi:hypothetical protein
VSSIPLMIFSKWLIMCGWGTTEPNSEENPGKVRHGMLVLAVFVKWRGSAVSALHLQYSATSACLRYPSAVNCMSMFGTGVDGGVADNLCKVNLGSSAEWFPRST